jgi:hypothetical protein
VILQTAPRVWQPGAVHDTVQAVVRGADFRKSLQDSLAERFFRWLGDGYDRLLELLRGAPSARSIALGVAGVVVLLIIARILLAARARDAGIVSARRASRGAAGDDPWETADRLAAAGQLEEAAHAIYRGVLAGLAVAERLRLDPSKTSGDYARELHRRGSSAHAPFRAFGRRFDLVVYGRTPCDRAALDELIRLAEPFRARARAA